MHGILCFLSSPESFRALSRIARRRSHCKEIRFLLRLGLDLADPYSKKLLEESYTGRLGSLDVEEIHCEIFYARNLLAAGELTIWRGRSGVPCEHVHQRDSIFYPRGSPRTLERNGCHRAGVSVAYQHCDVTVLKGEYLVMKYIPLPSWWS